MTPSAGCSINAAMEMTAKAAHMTGATRTIKIVSSLMAGKTSTKE